MRFLRLYENSISKDGQCLRGWQQRKILGGEEHH